MGHGGGYLPGRGGGEGGGTYLDLVEEVKLKSVHSPYSSRMDLMESLTMKTPVWVSKSPMDSTKRDADKGSTSDLDVYSLFW